MDARGSVVSATQIAAAGAASAVAAVVTSRFGVAGTLLGAAMTTMLITGGSAILKSYLDALSERARGLSGVVRRGDRPAATGNAPQDPAPQEEDSRRADTREVPASAERQGFFGRVRSAFGWFSGQSSRRKKSILLGAAAPAVIAFIIALVAITGVEATTGQPLSCLGSDCAPSAAGGGISQTSLGSIASGAGGGSPSGQPQDPGGGFRLPGFGGSGGAVEEQY